MSSSRERFIRSKGERTPAADETPAAGNLNLTQANQALPVGRFSMKRSTIVLAAPMEAHSRRYWPKWI